MRYMLLFLGLTATLCTTAQSWCAPGARWYHDYMNPSIGDIGYSVTEYLGDALFQDSICQQFAVTDHIYSLQAHAIFVEGPFDRYTTSTSDIVYLWTGLAFDTLFRWDAVPGDRWHVPGAWEDETSIIEVTDTGRMVLAGMDRRWLAAGTYLDGNPTQDTLVEGIGPIHAFLDLASSLLVDGGHAGLRCYEDDVNSYQRSAGPCAIALGMNDLGRPAQLKLSPNPGIDRLTISCDRPPPPNSTVQLVDAQGRTVINTSGASILDGLDLGSLAPGMYSVELLDDNGRRCAALWLKQ